MPPVSSAVPLNRAVNAALARQDVQIELKDVPHATAAVVQAIDDSPTVAVVEVKSAWLSRINWTQFAGVAATAAAWLGLDVSAETLLAIFGGVQAAVAVVTVILKTWFTPSVTPASAGK